MTKLLSLALLLSTVAVAAAQPSGAPMPPQPMPPPPPPPGYPPQPQPGYPPQPQPGYPPQQYVYVPPPVRDGLTFEANLGLGIFRVSSNGDSDSETGLGGLNVGIGGFLNPKLAISLRVAGVTYSEGNGSITQAFVGPSAQYFVNDNLFIGGGIGLGVARLTIDGVGSDSESGFALDLRAGYTFNPGSKHSFNASIEVTPAFIEDVEFTGIAFLAGYQLQ